ncbi:MAG: 50S ribosomal protein L15 [Chloroflexi bacterium]|nr:50S ribosomal protein L15 [Chloroflexota bacterium]
MKLHDLKPVPGSRRERTRVGRGIAAGKGKTAGRGTKGQKARAGGSIPAWFEGGQTPIHMRVPKLRGFKNRFKIEYQVVNVGRIAAAAELGRFDSGHPGDTGGTSPSGRTPVTVNAESLRAAGLISSVRVPVKVLGQGDLERPLFVLADAFTSSARQKIEAAGGSVQVIELPSSRTSTAALGVQLDGAPSSAGPGRSEADEGYSPATAPVSAELPAEGEAAEASEPTAADSPVSAEEPAEGADDTADDGASVDPTVTRRGREALAGDGAD